MNPSFADENATSVSTYNDKTDGRDHFACRVVVTGSVAMVCVGDANLALDNVEPSDVKGTLACTVGMGFSASAF
ncbi:hypothetical protein GN958_ATG08747 [Phytophthora infestans]|uniref:Uncharacterized protein n=1 Tax=Phytophthora infestans TaxID=4787 RepID=A0A8S9UR53_PHYIN|nr:hypothetical protein GN958_ATG08747 [Phytophthora infestans]